MVFGKLSVGAKSKVGEDIMGRGIFMQTQNLNRLLVMERRGQAAFQLKYKVQSYS